jgi:transcriptional regulator with XRE-family HTH domain
MDKSQIRLWVKDWLTSMRKRADLSQEAAAREAGISLGVVRSAEQTGSPPDLRHFLLLVMAYGAEQELVNQIREWRRASGQAVEPPRDKGDPPTGATAKPVPAKIKAALGTTPPSAKKSRPKTG